MNQIQNSVQLIGNLGADPSVVKTQKDNKLSMTRFRIATNEVYMKNESQIKDTQWHSCVAFGRKADTIIKYLKKGSKIAVQGKIRYGQYTDKNGQQQASTEIIVNDFIFLDSKTAA